MSYEEFLISPESEGYAEWVNGDVIKMSPASPSHQGIVEFLSTLLVLFNEMRARGRVFFAPLQMKLQITGREPDVPFLAKEHLDRIRKSHIEGPADIAVEVISPDSRGRDRGDKYVEYEQAGVREYWLIDPIRKKAEFYLLGADGTYELAEIGMDGIFRSTVLEGFWLKVDWLWQEPLPERMGVLKEWGLV